VPAMSVVAERSGRAGRLACWSSTVDLLAAVDERQLTVYRLNWQRLWSRSCDADVRVQAASLSSLGFDCVNPAGLLQATALCWRFDDKVIAVGFAGAGSGRVTLGAPRTPPFRQHYSAVSCSPWFGLVQMAASPCMTSSRARYVRKSWTPSWNAVSF